MSSDYGKIIEAPAYDQFLIVPPQGVLPGGGRQVVRLQWVGNPDLAASEAFYVSVEQLPVALEPGETETVAAQVQRSEEHTSELQSLMRISYAVFCLKKKNTRTRSARTQQSETRIT